MTTPLDSKYYYMLMDGRARNDYVRRRSTFLCTADTLEEAIESLELFAEDTIIFRVDKEGLEEPLIVHDETTH